MAQGHSYTGKRRLFSFAAALPAVAALVTCLSAPAAEMMVSTGSVWRYNDTGADLGTNWVALTYNDSTWSNGPAPLGFGDPLATTNLAPGAVTYYFRKTFVLTNAATVAGGICQFQADDGLVIHLNGVELNRSTLPTGVITYLTQATSSSVETNWNTVSVLPSFFRSGTNVLACEIHQHTNTSSDIRLEATLSIERTTETLVPTNSLWKYNDTSNDLGTAWRALGYDDSSWSNAITPAGFGDPLATTNLVKGAPTYYFRKSFVVSNALTITSAVCNLQVDDGAIVYLNNREIGRILLPSGAVSFATLATTSANPEDQWWPMSVVPTYFVTGTNVLAVEVHQVATTSSDMRLDARLVVEKAPGVTTAHVGVVISEILYNPYQYWPTNQPQPTTPNLEFVELYNDGTGVVDLSNYRFDNGISYTFPAGTMMGPSGYLVVAGSYIDFTNHYRSVTNVTGDFADSLNNAGERITLSKLVGITWVEVDTIRYHDGGRADGEGATLELTHPGFARFDDQAGLEWMTSLTSSGTPGTVNSVRQPMPPPVVGGTIHSPAVPPPGSAVKITADVFGSTTNAPTAVVLNYRVNANPTNAWEHRAMADDGLTGDLAAGDGQYSIYVPAYTGAPYGAGTILEFTITAFDALGNFRTCPDYSSQGVTSTPLSYLCQFSEDGYTDCAYAGEYETFRILMTSATTNYLNTRGGTNLYAAAYSDDLVDATVISPSGEIAYNCGVRYRGGSSRMIQPYPSKPYRVELPRDVTMKGYRELNFNHDQALQQYLAMRVFEEAGYDCHGLDVEPVRLWLNNEVVSTQANHRIDVLIQGFDEAMLADHGFDEPFGNLYRTDGDDYKGDLRRHNTLDDYKGPTTTNTSDPSYPFDGRGYLVETNNPYTVWHSLSNLSWQMTTTPSQLPTILTNRVNVRQWGRFYAVCICLNNDEAGMTSPFFSVLGDELRIYEDGTSGQFNIFPWDMGDVVTNASHPPWGPWSWDHSVITNFLYHPPMVNYYAGDCVDLMNNLLTTNSMAEIIAEMGSKGDQVRDNLLNQHVINRTNILNQIVTNLSILVNGTSYTGLPVAVATSLVTLSGQMPQNYTARMKVNGAQTPTLNLRSATWSHPGLVLSNTYNELVVEVLDVDSNVTQRKIVPVVYTLTSVSTSGVIATNSTWSSSAVGQIVSVTSSLTLPTGVTLTLSSNTAVRFQNGAGLILNGGRLSMLGAPGKPVTLFAAGGSANWVLQGGSNAVVSGTNIVMIGGRLALSNGALAYLESAILSDSYATEGIVRSSAGADVYLVNSIVERYGRMVAASNGTLRIEKTLLRLMRAAGMEGVGGRLWALHSTIAGSADGYVADGLRVSLGTVLGVTNCLVYDLAGSGAALSGTGVAGMIRYSAFYRCATGVHVEAAVAFSNLNNTIVDCTVALGGPQVLRDSIVWDNAMSLTNEGGGAITFSDVQLPMSAIQGGVSNDNRTPWFRSVADDDYSLLAISPFLTAASDGGWLGVQYTAGAMPAQPTNLTVSNVTATSATLAWADASSDEQWFEIQRSQDGVNWAVVGYAIANTTLYVDSSVTQSETYYYRVRAGHNRGNSLFTDVAGGTTPTAQTTQDLIDGIRITEIMYNPILDENVEFIELQNVGAQALDLTGLYFDEGRYAFPSNTILSPGQFHLLVKNASAWSNSYPTVSVQGLLGGSFLDNGGEQVWIKDAQTNTIVQVTYDDVAPWPPLADGSGHSLVLVNPPDDAPYDVSRWRASSYYGGSPGSNDPDSTLAGVVINEVLAHQDLDNPGDWIELYNSSTGSVSIGNWYLSDSSTTLTNFRIPSNTILAAGACTSYTEFASFGTNAIGARGFAISELGETLYLSSADTAGNLTSYRVVAEVDATKVDTTVGRVTNSLGAVDYVRLISPTRGASNSAPQVGPLVINEIMYNPGPGGREYIELYNSSNGSVALYSGTNVWEFDGAMEYHFAASSSIPAGSFALVVGMDPTEFRAVYGLTDMAVQVFGPFEGSLANGGETVKLYEPGDPETNGFVPRILVEKVAYDDSLPWPVAADNGGPSLERRSVWSYGNEPTNWTGASIGGTPGRANNTNGLSSVGFEDTDSDSSESNHLRQIAVTLFPVTTGTVSLSYSVAGSATPGSDHDLTNGTLVFWPYETNRYLSLPLLDDGVMEGDETVEIQLAIASGTAQLGGNSLHVHTIRDNDALVMPVPSMTPSGTVSFTGSVMVTLSTTSAIPGLLTRYTTDGRQPDDNSTLYTNAFTLTQSARITARHFLGSLNAGATTSALFLAQTPGPFSGPYWLGIVTNGGGTVTGGNVWVPSGSNVTLVATPDLYYGFGGWAGDVSGLSTNSTNVNVTMTANRNLIANFPPILASNGVPQSWLAQYYGATNFDAAALDDSDGDGLAGWEEYRAGTVPTNPFSLLAVTTLGSSNVFTLQWMSVTGRVYSIYRSTNMNLGWAPAPLVSNVAGAAGGTNSFSEVGPGLIQFYKVRVDLP